MAYKTYYRPAVTKSESRQDVKSYFRNEAGEVISEDSNKKETETRQDVKNFFQGEVVQQGQSTNSLSPKP
jgi:hypothetical protein